MLLIIKRRTFAELAVGQFAEAARTVTVEDVEVFAKVSGDRNPVHLDEAYAEKTYFRKRIAHGALIGSFISGLIGMDLPGPGTILISLNLLFRRPVYLGATVYTRVEIMELDSRRSFVKLACVCSVEGKSVVKGEAMVSFPMGEIGQ